MPEGKHREPKSSVIDDLHVQGAWGIQIMPGLRLPLSSCLSYVSLAGGYFLVLQVPLEWQDPVLIKDHCNDDCYLNDKAVVYLSQVFSVLNSHREVSFIPPLQRKKLRLRGLKQLA